uniref:Chromatin modification-related protein EAF7 n=1 Tax=Blastobotrys adeninivorans TaxID=409370 RepID=A0A060T900_BLAAD
MVEWTVQQETSLFRAICRFKPAGKHRHFRMISIYGTVNNPHVKGDRLSTADIWKKLGSYYNLEGIDELEHEAEEEEEEEELEDVEMEGDGGEEEENDEEKGEGGEKEPQVRVPKAEFSLPWADYGELMIAQAKNPASDASEPELDEAGDEQDEDEDEASHGEEKDESKDKDKASKDKDDKSKEVKRKKSTLMQSTAASRTRRTTRYKVEENKEKDKTKKPSRPQPRRSSRIRK